MNFLSHSSDLSSDGYGPAWKAIAIIPKFGATLSIISSGFLARHISKKGLRDVSLQSIMMFFISIMDIIGSFFGNFLSTWMVPSDLPRGYGAPFAAGNMATCEAQGFFVVMSRVYFAIAYTELAALYWLIVHRGWSKEATKKMRIRLAFLLPPPIIALGIAIPPLFFEMYNVGIYNCSVNPYPYDCDDIQDKECTRGRYATQYQVGLFASSLTCNVAIIIFMCMLVHVVYSQERKGDRYLFKGQEKNRAQTRKTAWQGVRYALVFTADHFSLYLFVGFAISPTPLTESGGYLAVAFLTVLLVPLLGFFNALVYFHPRYSSQREQNPNESRMHCICRVLDIDGIQWRSLGKGSTESDLSHPLMTGDVV